ncbi:MAG: protein TolR [Pseudomonadota bacterium]
MGASINSNGASGKSRRAGQKKYTPMSEINVTPFVDVMLVLLIIFMVTAPLLTVGVPIELPKTKAKQLSSQKEPLTISVDKTGRIFIQDTEIQLQDIAPKLIAITKSGFDEDIYVRGDQETAYGVVAKVMGTISSAGFRRISFVMDADQSG